MRLQPFGDRGRVGRGHLILEEECIDRRKTILYTSKEKGTHRRSQAETKQQVLAPF